MQEVLRTRRASVVVAAGWKKCRIQAEIGLYYREPFLLLFDADFA